MKSADYRASAGLEADLAEARRPAPAKGQEPLPALTLEVIERDPWNAVGLPLPTNAGAALLQVARSAATYCADGEHELMLAAREGRYTPPGWTGAEGEPDVHEYNEARWLQAGQLLELTSALPRAKNATLRLTPCATTLRSAVLAATKARAMTGRHPIKCYSA